MNSSKIIRFLPAILWMILIFFLSSRSTAGIVEGTLQRFLFFKSLHLIEYAILGILVFFAVSKNNYTLIISYLYAITDEIHQSFVPGRGPKFTDTLIDLLGICLGLLILKYLRKYLSNYYSSY